MERLFPWTVVEQTLTRRFKHEQTQEAAARPFLLFQELLYQLLSIQLFAPASEDFVFHFIYLLLLFFDGFNQYRS